MVISDGPTLGVMGGMGPYASVDFLSRLLAATPGGQDQDHFHVIIDHNPRIPNRHQSIAGTGPDVTDDLVTMAKRLETAGADYLVLCCNTAHAYSDAIQAAVDIPFISIIDVTVRFLSDQHAGRTIGLIATDGCLRAELYQKKFSAAGLEAIYPSDHQLEKIMTAVFEIKAGNTGAEISQALLAVANDLIFSGADLIVSACTELPLVLSPGALSVPLIDPTDLLVRECVALGSGSGGLPKSPLDQLFDSRS